MYKRHIIGKIGEELAVKYLKQIGYKIIERNFKCRLGEIDIIALEKNEIIFIEVKTRTSIKYGHPADAVNENKQKHLIKSVKYYLYLRSLENEYVRIDVIEMYLYKNKYKVNHIKQII